MDFLGFLGDYVSHLSVNNPAVIALGVLVLALAFTKRWLQVFMVLGIVVIGKAIEYYFPAATGGIVGDMTVVQIIYIVGRVIIAITTLGEMVLRH